MPTVLRKISTPPRRTAHYFFYTLHTVHGVFVVLSTTPPDWFVGEQPTISRVFNVGPRVKCDKTIYAHIIVVTRAPHTGRGSSSRVGENRADSA